MPPDKRARVQSTGQGDDEDVDVTPAQVRAKPDAMKLLNGISICTKLRSITEFSNVLQDVDIYNSNCAVDPPPRDASGDPTRADLLRAYSRSDIVGMLIERRVWAEEIANDDVASIHCQSDGSPVVGAELQGMVAEIVHRSPKSVRRLTLPGSTLHYGHMDATNKAIAFLWALWLVVGPSQEMVQAFLDRVHSFTTDFGVEIGIVRTPDVLSAFFAWIRGRPLEACRTLVRHTHRLFHRSLRIVGWNHTCSGIAKGVAHVAPSWPDILDKVSALCQFMRNETWRLHLAKAAAGRVAGAKEKLQHFTANLTKWRYATIWWCFSQLVPLQQICQVVVREEIFAECQDRVLLQRAVNASRDVWFWKFAVASFKFLWEPLEACRRWGMICDCCGKLRAEGAKHVACPRNSRRLRTAWTEVQQRVQKLRENATSLKPADCDGSGSVCSLVKSMMRKCADILLKRFGYLGRVPWIIVNAHTVAGAAEVVRQIEAVPLADHDPATRDFEARLGSDVRARARGEACSTALQDEADAKANSPLDEKLGEGYHRETTYEKHRAPGSSMPHLKQSTRIKGVIKTIRAFKQRHGPAGAKVIDFEYAHWQRILQTSQKHRWRVRRMKASAMIKRIYREDAMADEDWSAICTGIPVDRPTRTDDASDREKLEREYLAATLLPLQYYGVEAEAEVPQDDGAVVRERQTTYFQVLGTQTARTREKTMHCWDSREDIHKTSSMLVHVIWLSRWERPGDPQDDVLRVHEDGEAEWVQPQHITPSFDNFQNHMVQYCTSVVDPDEPCVYILSGPRRAAPRFAITDPRTPVLALVWHLRNEGWLPVPAYHEHSVVPSPGAPQEFDSREAMRMKTYYQALVCLDRCLPLCDGPMPSQHPMAFYKLLLAGFTATPNMTAKEYIVRYNRKLKNPTADDFIPPIVDQPPGDPEDFIVQPIGAPPPDRQPRSSGPGIRGRAGARGAAAASGSGGPRDPGGGRGTPSPPVPLPGPGPVAPPPPVDDEDEDDHVAPPSSGPVAPPKKKKEDRPWQPGLDGCEVIYDPYTTPLGKPAFNYLLKCPHHTGCMKSRGDVPAHCRHYGDVEPLAFLHAWSHIPWPTDGGKQTHRLENPAAREVAEYAKAHLQELQDLWQTLRP